MLNVVWGLVLAPMNMCYYRMMLLINCYTHMLMIDFVNLSHIFNSKPNYVSKDPILITIYL